MKSSAIALAALFAVGSASAAIAPGSSGNGELFLNVVDPVAKISYVLDLGLRMDDFFIAAQQEVGYQYLKAVESTAWDAFLASGVNTANLAWSVVAIDSVGSNAAGNQRLYTTVRQGDEAKVTSTTNSNFTNGIGATQAGNFFIAVNGLSAHLPSTDYTMNADSYSLETDSGRGYYGESGGLTPNYNGNGAFNATNPVGSSAWFYYVTRSGTSNTTSSRVTVDEFDNLGFDGYWGFVKVEDQDNTSPFYDPTSPYAGKYLLSFTMPVFDVRTTASFQAFAASINRTEFSGGLQVIGLDGAAAAAVTERSAGWVVPLGAASAVTAVPEPGQWALLLAGGTLLAWRRRARGPRA